MNTRNPYQGDYNTMYPLHKFCDDHDVTILLVHHLRKMRSVDPFDDILGTSGLFGASDGAYIFRKESSESSDVKLFFRGRDMPERILTIRFNNTLGHWDLVKENTPVEDAFQNDEDLRKVLEYLKEHGSFDGTATEFCNLIQARKKPQSISGKLWNRKNELVKMGFIFTREHTRDGSHITFRKVEQLPQKVENTIKGGCYPFDLVLCGNTIELNQHCGNKAVTSSQSSQE